MATNWPQQLNPRAWRSARCSRTARSNSVRENNCNIWLKILDTRITAVLVLPMVHVFSTQTVAEFYRRRSKANLDKSDLNPKPILTRRPQGSQIAQSRIVGPGPRTAASV